MSVAPKCLGTIEVEVVGKYVAFTDYRPNFVTFRGFLGDCVPIFATKLELRLFFRRRRIEFHAINMIDSDRFRGFFVGRPMWMATNIREVRGREVFHRVSLGPELNP